MSVDQLLLVDVFSQLYYLTYAKKQQCRTYRYKSLKSWKIDNIDLTQQFSLSIFTDFRYQSIKITWLLSIFIDWLLRAYAARSGFAAKSHSTTTQYRQLAGYQITQSRFSAHCFRYRCSRFQQPDMNLERW